MTTTQTMLLLTAAVALYLLWRRKAVPAAAAALPAPSIAAAPAGLSVPPMAAPDAAAGIADVGAQDSASPSPARPGLIQTSVGLALTPLKLGASIAKGAVHTTEHVLGDLGSGIGDFFSGGNSTAKADARLDAQYAKNAADSAAGIVHPRKVVNGILMQLTDDGKYWSDQYMGGTRRVKA